MKNTVLEIFRRFAIGAFSLWLAGCAVLAPEESEDSPPEAVAAAETAPVSEDRGQETEDSPPVPASAPEAAPVVEIAAVVETSPEPVSEDSQPEPAPEPVAETAPPAPAPEPVAEAAPPEPEPAPEPVAAAAPPAPAPAPVAAPPTSAQRAEAALRVLAQRAGAAREGKARKPTEAEIEDELTRLADEIKGAIRDRDFAAARAGLERMEIIAPQSLSPLRLRAWLAVADERTDEARQLYRQILDRLDGDENAGVNLAILEARGGNRDAAMKILSGLSVRHPDSESIQAMRRMLGADGY